LQEDGLLTKKVDDTIEWMHNRIQELKDARLQNA
jgi:pantothenate kinase